MGYFKLSIKLASKFKELLSLLNFLAAGTCTILIFIKLLFLVRLGIGTGPVDQVTARPRLGTYSF